MSCSGRVDDAAKQHAQFGACVIVDVRYVLQVADLIKADRLVRLNAVVNEIAEERAQRFLGRTLEVSDFLRRMECQTLENMESYCHQYSVVSHLI